MLHGLRPGSIEHWPYPGQKAGEPETVFHLRVPTAGDLAEIEDAWQPMRDGAGNLRFLHGSAVLTTLRKGLAGWDNLSVGGAALSFVDAQGKGGTDEERLDRAISVIPGDAREVISGRIRELGRLEPKN